nr:M67 family metallopeptidase [Roseospira navarrensis]
MPAGARAVLLDHMRAAWPREGCGLLVGSDDTQSGALVVEAVHPTTNVDASGRPDRFEVDPAARFDLMRQLRGRPSRLIGHVHSHPGHPAEPSETDRRAAFEPDLVWVIVGLADRTTPDPPVTAWTVVPGPEPGAPAAGFRPLPIISRS